MSEDRLGGELEALLAGLQGGRGSCPDEPSLRSWEAGALAADEAERVATHVALCAACRETLEEGMPTPLAVDDAAWQAVEARLDGRPLPWRAPRWRAPAWIALAASLVAALGVGLWLRQQPAPSAPTAIDRTRGAVVQPIAPAGEVAAIEAFEWADFHLAEGYRIEVEANGEPLLVETVADSRYVPPGGPLRPGRYRWRVVALAPDGGSLGGSPWVEVEVTGPGG